MHALNMEYFQDKLLVKKKKKKQPGMIAQQIDNQKGSGNRSAESEEPFVLSALIFIFTMRSHSCTVSSDSGSGFKMEEGN